MMGSPLSFIIEADIVMRDLETCSLALLPVTPLFYFRYVDDIALAIIKLTLINCCIFLIIIIHELNLHWRGMETF